MIWYQIFVPAAERSPIYDGHMSYHKWFLSWVQTQVKDLDLFTLLPDGLWSLGEYAYVAKPAYQSLFPLDQAATVYTIRARDIGVEFLDALAKRNPGVLQRTMPCDFAMNVMSWGEVWLPNSPGDSPVTTRQRELLDYALLCCLSEDSSGSYLYVAGPINLRTTGVEVVVPASTHFWHSAELKSETPEIAEALAHRIGSHYIVLYPEGYGLGVAMPGVTRLEDPRRTFDFIAMGNENGYQLLADKLDPSPLRFSFKYPSIAQAWFPRCVSAYQRSTRHAISGFPVNVREVDRFRGVVT